jgi:DNA mismatch endonuclease (patch repair protein)
MYDKLLDFICSSASQASPAVIRSSSNRFLFLYGPCLIANDTKPEMIVRHYLFKQGYRYRLHVHTMPGSPDIVLRKYRSAIFVNGCFWHGHDGCKYNTIPKTNTEFWTAKIERNKERDAREAEELKKMGWNVIRIWECHCRKRFTFASKRI